MKSKALKVILIILISTIAFCLVCALCWLVAFLTSSDTDLPRLDLTVDGKVTSKEEYVPCSLTLSDGDTVIIDGVSGGIRGRGNTTWKYPKKPYRLKLDSKTSFFGEAPSKSWVLLAMYNDFSLSKDALAFKLGASLDNGDYVPSYNYVELYVNGIYKGLYLLTEQINENKEHTNVKCDFDKNDTEVPFLVELDDYAELDGGIEGEDYFKIGNLFYTVKYPDKTERYTKAQFDYIKNYVTKVHSLCYKENVTLDELAEYIDVGSFIDYFLIQEIVIQPDINYKSVYMYKSVDGKMKMGPLWDYDWALSGPSLAFWYDYELKETEFCSKGTWFYALLTRSPEFRQALKVRWAEIEDKIRIAASDFYEENQRISKAAHKDWLRYHYYNSGATFMRNFERDFEVLYRRIDWLDNEINNL